MKQTPEQRAADKFLGPVITDIGYKNMRIGFATCIREEVEPLEQWKESAIKVMGEWGKVHEALGKPGKLGESMAAASVAEIERLRSLVQELVDTGHKMRLAVGDLTVIENAMEDDDGSYGLDDLNAAWIRLAQAAMDWDVTPTKQAGFVPTNTEENGN